ncbi:MAG: hypothetical protein AB7K37_08225 [Cyclobacteriaceae bacterium]
MNSPWYVVAQLGFVATSVIFIGLLFQYLRSALKAAGYDSAMQRRIFGRTLMGTLLWVSIVSVLSISGFLQDFSTFPPRMMIVLVVPLITIIGISTTKRLKHILSFIPPQRIIGLQVFRVFVELLLWLLFVIELLPVQMTFEGRNFDVLAGLTAPVVAYFCFVRKVWSKTVAVVWNFLSLALLINIVTIALLSIPSPFRHFMNEPANTIVAHFPIVWLPAILVPLAYTLHIFSLIQLLGKRDGEGLT